MQVNEGQAEAVFNDLHANAVQMLQKYRAISCMFQQFACKNSTDAMRYEYLHAKSSVDACN
jgi:hypothetical protein